MGKQDRHSNTPDAWTSVIIQMLCLVLFLNYAIYLHNSYEVSIIIILILQIREQTLTQDLNKRLLF